MYNISIFYFKFYLFGGCVRTQRTPAAYGPGFWQQVKTRRAVEQRKDDCGRSVDGGAGWRNMIHRHVSFMRMWLPHTSLIAAFFSKVRISHKFAFSTAILILFVFPLPISIIFCYLNHLVADRMAPSRCPDPRGTRWNSWFRAILYHTPAAYLVFMHICLKRPHKTDMPR